MRELVLPEIQSVSGAGCVHTTVTQGGNVIGQNTSCTFPSGYVHGYSTFDSQFPDGGNLLFSQGAFGDGGGGTGPIGTGVPDGYQQGSLSGASGDTNGDGEINGADYFQYTTNADGTVTATGAHFGMWDFNGDGIANDGAMSLVNVPFSSTSLVSMSVSQFSQGFELFIPLYTNATS